MEWDARILSLPCTPLPTPSIRVLPLPLQPGNPHCRVALGNLDTSGLGALSRARGPERIRELTAMFTDIRRAHPEAEAFAGGSWLYNLPAYQALFPPEYIATMNPTRPRFTYMKMSGAITTGSGM